VRKENTVQQGNRTSAFILGVFIALGLAFLGYFLASAAIEYKQYERTVTVKGLSERELGADVVIWPIQFTVPENDLDKLYALLESNTAKIRAFLLEKGVTDSELTVSVPNITDKAAQQYGPGGMPEFRFTAVQTVTVYSKNVLAIREIMSSLSELGKQGIALSSGNYESQTEYIFDRLNEVKPQMIEEATRQAREVAEKFASDSNSKLGKIKSASQGQFTISDRDKNNPHIKKVRVVSTVEYYLSD
jgi:hypothetical protein